MTDAILNREAVLVPVSDIDPATRLNREGVAVAHSLPSSAITTRLNRVGVLVAISRPHGWDLFAESPMIAP